jgi:hypothetical protein
MVMKICSWHTLVLFLTTAQSLVFALLRVSAMYCSHHQRAMTLLTQAAYHMSVNGKHICVYVYIFNIY